MRILWFSYLVLLGLLSVCLFSIELLRLCRQHRHIAVLKVSIREVFFLPVLLAIYLVASGQTAGGHLFWRVYLFTLVGYVCYVLFSGVKMEIKDRLKQEFSDSPVLFCIVVAALIIPAIVAILLCTF